MKPATFLFGVISVASVLTEPHTDAASLSPDPMQLLPPSQCHEFRPAPANWTQKIEFWRPEPNEIGLGEGFVGHRPGEAPNLATDWKWVSFFDKPDAKQNTYRKLLCYRPDGTLASETDRTEKAWFKRGFYRNGAVAFFEEGASSVDAAASISPDGKTTTRFSGGNGDVIRWDDEPNSFTHSWYGNGGAYLEKRFKAGRLFSTRLNADQVGDMVLLASGEEQLNFYALHEFWSKKSGEPVSAQVADFFINGVDGSVVRDTFPDDEVKKRIRSLFFVGGIRNSQAFEQGRAKLIRQLENDYRERRADFLARYDKVLRATGQTWSSVGLDALTQPFRVAPS